MLRPILFILLTVFSTSADFCRELEDKQPLPQKTTPKNDKKANAQNPKQKQDETKSQEHLNTILLVRSFVDRAKEFKDLKIKIRTLVRFADLLWSEDAQEGRTLFLKAYDLVKAAQPVEGKDKLSQLTAGDLMALRRTVIAGLARRDKVLALKLLEAEINDDYYKNGPGQKAQPYLDSAFSLIDSDYKAAVNFVEKSLQYGVSRRLIWFLNNLKRQDEQAANVLFRLALKDITQQSVVDANDFLMLGTYIFTSPATDLGQLGESSVVMIPVGGVAVANISANRPNASPELIRLYVDAAASILSRTTSDLKQKQVYYLAAYQLYNKALEYAPDRAPALANVLSFLSPDIPASLKQESALAIFSRTRLSIQEIDEEIRKIETITNPSTRAARCLSAAHEFYIKGDFAKSRTIAQKNINVTDKENLIRVIDFGEIAKLIEQGELLDAEQRTARLTAGVERAVLWLDLGQAWSKKGDVTRASENINAALKDARRLVDVKRACITLCAAGLLAPIDSVLAQQTLSEAAHAFNTENDLPSDYARMVQVIEAGSARRTFSLKVKEVDFSIGSTMKSLIDADKEGTISIVTRLKNEQVLADGLVTLAGLILKQNPEK